MIPIVEKRVGELEQLCVRYNVSRLDLFGSAVTGEHRPGGERPGLRGGVSAGGFSEPMPTPTSGCWRLWNPSSGILWTSSLIPL